MRRFSLALFTAVVVPLSIAACGGGGGDDDDGIDAAPADADVPVAICGTAAGTISAYPGTFSGTRIGAGADLRVAGMACSDGRLYFGAVGDEQEGNLVNLPPGTTNA